MIIAGLPRTGTTHLHQLVAASGVFRTLPYWESVEPFPLPAEVGVEPDPRRARMDLAVDFLNSAMPHFRLMHEMTTDHVHEEIQLLANDFSTMLMETLAYVPRWRDYYLAHDQTPHYEHLRLQLQALQFLRGGRRWALKSPQHLEQLPVVDRVFPGATVVITHRDPVPVVVSMVTMIVYTARMHRSKVPVTELATAWADRLGLMLDAVVRDLTRFRRSGRWTCDSTTSWRTSRAPSLRSWRSPARTTQRRRKTRSPTTWPTTDATGMDAWQPAPSSSGWTPRPCAVGIARTRRASSEDAELLRRNSDGFAP